MSDADADRDEGGRFSPLVSDDDILSAFDRTDDPVLTAAELADSLPISRSAVRERLLDLEEREVVARKTAGARAVVWWRVTDTDSDDDAPAAPLRELVGMVDEETAENARKRSKEWRERFERELDPTEEETRGA